MTIRPAFSLGIVLLSACTVTHPVEPATKPALRESDVFEFSTNGRDVALRAVRFSGDSVSGFPRGHPRSARESYAIADLSKSRVTRADHTTTAIVLALWGVATAFGAVMAIGFRGD